MMLLLPANTKVHMAFGVTDMRKGIDGLAMLVQEVLHQDPFSGHLFVFRGRKANFLKIVFWDGCGLCLFTKRLEQGVLRSEVSPQRHDNRILTTSTSTKQADGSNRVRKPSRMTNV